MSDKTLVSNAASKKQVTEAVKKEKRSQNTEMNDLRVVLQTSEGRRVLNRILDKCGAFRSIWVSSAAIHYNSGQQDIGHWLMENIGAASPEGLQKIVLENYVKEK